MEILPFCSDISQAKPCSNPPETQEPPEIKSGSVFELHMGITWKKPLTH